MLSISPIVLTFLFSAITIKTPTQIEVHFPDVPRRDLPVFKKVRKDERCAALQQWLYPFVDEHPDLHEYFFNKKGYLLFSDRVFIPMFGKAYDAMSKKERKRIFKSGLSHCPGMPSEKVLQIRGRRGPLRQRAPNLMQRGRPAKQVQQFMDILQAALPMNGRYDPEPTEKGVVANRRAWAWIEQSQTDIAQLTDADAVLQVVNLALKALKPHARHLWPSEAEQVTAAYVAVQRQAAEAVMVSFLAKSQGQNGAAAAQTIAAAYTKHQRTLKLLDPSRRQRIQTRYESLLRDTLRDEIRAFENQITQLTPNLDGWLFASRIGDAAAKQIEEIGAPRNVYAPLFAKIEKQQERLLELAHDDWQELVEHAPEPRDLFGALDDIFPERSGKHYARYLTTLTDHLEAPIPTYRILRKVAPPWHVFTFPTVVRAVASGDFDQIPDDKFFRVHVMSMVRGFKHECSTCKLTNNQAKFLIDYGMGLSANRPGELLRAIFEPMARFSTEGANAFSQLTDRGFTEEGVVDGYLLGQALKENPAMHRKTWDNLKKLFLSRYKIKIAATNRDRMLGLMNPKKRTELGYRTPEHIEPSRTELLAASCINDSDGDAGSVDFCRCVAAGVARGGIPEVVQHRLIYEWDSRIVQQLSGKYMGFVRISGNCWR